jgi:hypothetical protein
MLVGSSGVGPYHRTVADAPPRSVLEAAACWESTDVVPGRPAMTTFRRCLRYHQGLWREANGHPIGTQPIEPKPGDTSRPLGSRLPLTYARETGANFVSPGALQSVRTRLASRERHQTLNGQRLWADLLSSMPLCFNVFGELDADSEAASNAVRRWWPDAPSIVSEIKFEHSPGRLDPAYLGNRSAFDAAILLDCGDGSNGIIGIETKYHERTAAEAASSSRLARYIEVSNSSGIFRPGAIDTLIGTDLQQIWLDHLLVLAMLQHPDHRWTWGRFVLVHPRGNTDFAQACVRYRELLTTDKTFGSVTLEDLLNSGALKASTSAVLRARYLPA